MQAKRMFMVLVLPLAMMTAAIAQETKPADAPKLFIQSLQHDFGEIKAGTALSYSFIVKNQGKANLEIKSVAPS